MELSVRIKSSNFLSKAAVLICAAALLSIIFNLRQWKAPFQIIDNDIISYYSYLPGAFIYHDLTLKFTDHPPPDYRGRFWPFTLPNGGKIIKMSMGLAIMYLPFFTIGHLVAGITGQIQDGYSPAYCLFMLLGSACYVIIALILLRRILLLFFNDKVSALAIVSVFFGTNLLYYSSNEPLMSHSFGFFLNVLFLYFILEWHKNPVVKNSLKLGFSAGLLILARPSNIVSLVIFFLYGIYSYQTLKEKLNLLKTKWMQLMLIGICILLVFFPQMLYWKWNSGEWLFYSYMNEKFYFNKPHIIDGLFSFRKGWFIYTPIMLFAITGLFAAKKFLKDLAVPLAAYTVLNIWIVTSWWCWWYGGGYGNRAFIDSFGLLALPLAGFYNLLSKRKTIFRMLTVIIFVLIGYQIFQTFQYRYQAIHYDSMTREAYKKTFLKLKPNDEFYKALKAPDIENALKGLDER